MEELNIFIGSSTEAKDVAEAIYYHLDKPFNVTLWDYGVYKSGESTLESIENNLKQYDFAIFILSEDDLTKSRGTLKKTPRDNIIFEIGLFIGRIGRRRTFIVKEENADLKIPSDLNGITIKFYKERQGRNNIETVRPMCMNLKIDITDLGKFIGEPSSLRSLGVLEYSNSFKNREMQYREIVENANNDLFIIGTALQNITTNSLGKLLSKLSLTNLNLLMLDPIFYDNQPQIQNIFNGVYRENIFSLANNSLNKIIHVAEGLGNERNGKLNLYVTKFFLPIAAVIADPESEDGTMVVEVIGASNPEKEYFSRPRYKLIKRRGDNSMFNHYWELAANLFSEPRSSIYQKW